MIADYLYLAVTSPATGKFVPEFTINASEIVELVEAGRENVVPRAPPKAIPVAPAPAKKTFEDPAILSMGKRPAFATRPSIADTWTSSTSMERADSSRTARAGDERTLREITPAAILVDPMLNLAVVENEDEEVEEVHILDNLGAEPEVSPIQQQAKPAKKPRKRKPKKEKEDGIDPAVTPAKDTVKSKGWRQTPLLEPNPSFQPYSTLKRKGRRNGNMEESGWGTEDATDVQELGDFDFLGSLAKFDKHTVFTQIQAEDSVADEDRLVAHNRLPKAKPGTAGGKNLHYTENVLEVPKPNGGTPKMKAEAWKSEDSEVEERASQKGSGSGRISRRAGSRLPSNRRSDSRKGSSTTVNIPPARTHSVSSSSISETRTLTYSRFQCRLLVQLSSLFRRIVAANQFLLCRCSI